MTSAAFIPGSTSNTAFVRQNAFSRAVADLETLRTALADADAVPQALLYAQLTGDTDFLDRLAPHVEGGWSFMQHVPDDLAVEIRERLIAALTACADGQTPVHSHPTEETFRTIMSAGIGRELPAEYATMFLEEFEAPDIDLRDVVWRREPSVNRLEEFRVVIVGAGLSGICLGIKLKAAGIPFVIYEKNDRAGGTWYENNYPGCGVDIPSHFYSFSFEPKHDWQHHFAKRHELWAYLEHCVEKYGIRDHIVFGAEVTRAEYDEAASRWTVSRRDIDGSERQENVNIVVTAVGQLNRPSVPSLEGLEAFIGPSFHTAEWDGSIDLSGKKVAVIGTGASAMQTCPSIATDVAELQIYQRTPHWASPNPNYLRTVSPGMQWALREIPYFDRWYRFLLFWASGDVLHRSLQRDEAWNKKEISLNAENHSMRETLIRHIESELAERPDLQERVTPTYPPYGKRMLRDNGWYRMLLRDNVELIDGGVEHVDATGIVDAKGKHREVDVIVLATGFQAGRLLWPMEIVGREARNIRDLWGEDDATAYLGMTVPKFPNFFIMYGPNTNLAHGGSLFFHAECQTRYILQSLRELLETNHKSLEIRSHVHDDYNRRVDDAHNRMVWTHPGMANWYRNRKGRVVANSPWRLVDYWQLTAELNPDKYIWQ